MRQILVLQVLTITGVTDTTLIQQIVDVLIFDKDNIFVIGNNTTDETYTTSKILKFSFNTGTKRFQHEGTQVITEGGNNILKIFYAKKYESDSGERSIILLNGSGIDGEWGWKIMTMPLDLDANQVTFTNFLNSSLLFPETNSFGTRVKIINFKVKRDIILVLFEDVSNSNRYFQSYKIQLSVTDIPLLKVKTSNSYSETELLSEVDIHNVLINANYRIFMLS